MKIFHLGKWIGSRVLYEDCTAHQFSGLMMSSNVSTDRSISTAINQWYFSKYQEMPTTMVLD
jgi:hypothetical protein